jgi:hypothetical protein
MRRYVHAVVGTEVAPVNIEYLLFHSRIVSSTWNISLIIMLESKHD